MKIRALTAEHATRCAELEQQLFPGDNPWPRDVFLVEFNHPWTFYWGIFDEDLLVGYAGIAMLGPREDPEFEVHTVGVDPAYQGRGLGRALMDQMVHTADTVDAQMFLEVRTDNEPAIKLYEKYGFTVLATRKNYYQPSGADAYSMARKSLSESRGETRGEK